MLMLITAALASPLNPWGSATPAGAALVNPYVYVYPDAVNPILYGSVGVSENVDLYAGFGELLPTAGSGVGSLEVFPRFFLVPQLALAPHVYWTPGVDGVVVAPEAHVNFSAGVFSFVGNAGWRPVLHTSGVDLGTVPVILAPEVKLGDRLSAYLEVDPTISLDGKPLALLLVPGFGFTVDDRQSLSVGLQVPVLPSVGTASFGAWYTLLVPAS